MIDSFPASLGKRFFVAKIPVRVFFNPAFIRLFELLERILRSELTEKVSGSSFLEGASQAGIVGPFMMKRLQIDE